MRFRLLLAAAAVLLALSFGAGGASAQVTLHGAGATFPSPLYAQWFAAFSKRDPSVRFAYDAVGSGQGQKLISDGAVDFGATDAPMSQEALANAPGKILHMPTVGGADCVTFNLHGVRELRLDGATLAAIFLGKITQWNDPAVARQNPGIRLPDEEITVAHRADASGTSYIFTDYLCKVSPEWKLKVGRYMLVHWPVGVGLQGSDGVSKFIRKTPGAIGYVELLYAIQNRLAHASIKNSAGAYIKASTASITAALSTAAIPADFRVSIVDAAGPASYPIAGVTWLLVYEKPQDAVKTKKMAAFLKWAMTEGQAMAPDLNFAPLPPNVKSRVLDEINSISPGG